MSIMPLGGNIVGRSGIGPLTLRDAFVLRLGHVPALPVSFWLVITALSLLGAGLLVATLGVLGINLIPRLRFGGKASDGEAVGIFLLLSAISYLLPALMVGGWDRYVVPAMPFAVAGIAALSGRFAPSFLGIRRIPLFAAGTLLAAFSVFAIGGTRDYLAWNRVRWQALHDLMKKDQVKAQDIDGGFEFNGLYLYDPNYREVPEKSEWWVQGDTYQIGFDNVPGYHIFKQYTYPHWLPPYAGKVVVLQKNAQTDEIIRQSQEAIRLRPDYAEAHNNLGVALSQKGQTDEAIRQLREAIRLKPEYADAHNNLGAALVLKGQTDEAIRHFQEALRLKPGYASARKNLDAALAAKAGSSPPPGVSTNR